MYHRVCIIMESDLVFARESANTLELIRELVDQVVSGPDGLGCFRGCSRLGCGPCCGSRCRMCAGSPDCDGTVHLHDCKFSLEGRPSMAVPGVSATYQYDFTLWDQQTGQSGCQVMGPWSAPYRGIWDPL